MLKSMKASLSLLYPACTRYCTQYIVVDLQPAGVEIMSGIFHFVSINLYCSFSKTTQRMNIFVLLTDLFAKFKTLYYLAYRLRLASCRWKTEWGVYG